MVPGEVYSNSVRRVLMTTDTIGGVWTYSLELARSLQRYNIEVVLASMGGLPSIEQKQDAAKMPNVSLFESTYKLEWMENPWEDVQKAGQWLLDLEVLTQPDVIHLNDYSHGKLNFESPSLIVGHSCVYSWYYAVKHHEPHDAWRRYRQEVTAGLRDADIVTAPTNAMLNELRIHYGQFNSAGAVYNSRKADEFLPKKKEPFVLSAGRLWDEAKNVSMLAYVAPRLKWPVYVAGEKEDPDGRFIPFEGVNWLGKLQSADLGRWMSKAPIFALPAKYEPFGLSALEAALSGCALVLGDIPTLREVWEDTAIFVDPEDYEGLCARINELIQNDRMRIEAAKKVRRRALSFTPERMGDKYLSLYSQLVRQKHKMEINKN
ncbi:MAG: glycosyltransferase family 4 protein [Bacillota bacterium]